MLAAGRSGTAVALAARRRSPMHGPLRNRLDCPGCQGRRSGAGRAGGKRIACHSGVGRGTQG
eukprot:14322682-Alexandrium_andersonii.AAC.1